MRFVLIGFLFGMISFTSIVWGQSNDSISAAKIELGVRLLKLSCGTGIMTQDTKLDGNASIGITIRKLTGPEAGASVHYDSHEAEGLASALFNASESFSQAQMKCMQPYINDLWQMIFGHPPPPVSGSEQHSDGGMAPKNFWSLFGWLDLGTSSDVARRQLNDHSPYWQKAGDGREYVSYPSIVGGLRFVTTSYFDFANKVRLTKSVAASKRPTNIQGQIEPGELCGNGKSISKYISSRIGEPIEEPRETVDHLHPADWQINCEFDSNCRTFADVLLDRSHFRFGKSDLFFVTDYTDADAYGDDGPGRPQHHYRSLSCDIEIEMRPSP